NRLCGRVEQKLAGPRPGEFFFPLPPVSCPRSDWLFPFFSCSVMPLAPRQRKQLTTLEAGNFESLLTSIQKSTGSVVFGCTFPTIRPRPGRPLPPLTLEESDFLTSRVNTMAGSG